MALAQRRPRRGSLIHHSDRGVQYACGDYTRSSRAHGMPASMSRVGNPYDNAKAESFMKTLKREEVDGQAYRDLAEASAAHRHLHRGGLQPRSACTRPWAIARPPSSRRCTDRLRPGGTALRERLRAAPARASA